MIEQHAAISIKLSDFNLMRHLAFLFFFPIRVILEGAEHPKFHWQFTGL